MPKQVRAVIARDLVPLADKILTETGISTHSQLVCLLIKNYGDALAKSIKGQQTSS